MARASNAKCPRIARPSGSAEKRVCFVARLADIRDIGFAARLRIHRFLAVQRIRESKPDRLLVCGNSRIASRGNDEPRCRLLEVVTARPGEPTCERRFDPGLRVCSRCGAFPRIPHPSARIHSLRDSDTVARGDATHARQPRFRPAGRRCVGHVSLGMFKLDRLLAGLLPAAVARGLRHAGPRLRLRRHRHAAPQDAPGSTRPVRDHAVKPEHVVHPDTTPVEVVLQLYRGANNLPVTARNTGSSSAWCRRATCSRHSTRRESADARRNRARAPRPDPRLESAVDRDGAFVVTYLVIMSDRAEPGDRRAARRGRC